MGRPGIAKAWIDKYYSDVFPHDYFMVNGKKMRPPKFYDGHFELVDPAAYKKLKSRRKKTTEAQNFEVGPRAHQF